MKAWFALLRHEIRVVLREGGAVGTVLGFYAIVITMMPIALGPDLKLLARIAPGIIWIAFLLAALLSLSRLYERDLEDGSLDLMVIGAMPLEAVTFAKSLAHWLTTCLPLAAMTPVMGLFLNIDYGALPLLITTLLIGTIAVSFLGAVAAALTLRARIGGVLIALIVLPLYVPTLIYGITAITALMLTPDDAISPLLMLAAISLISLVVGPVAAAAVLRYQVR
jgi:heme exporter protein B